MYVANQNENVEVAYSNGVSIVWHGERGVFLVIREDEPLGNAREINEDAMVEILSRAMGV